MRASIGTFVVALAVAGCAGTSPSAPAQPGSLPIPTNQSPTPPQTQAAATPTGPGITITEQPASSPATGITTVDGGGAYPKVRYTPNTLILQAGSATLFFANVPVGANHLGSDHNLAIGTVAGQPLVQSKVLRPGQGEQLTIAGLSPGTYVFFCTVHDGSDPAHYLEGMVGTLTITP